MQSLIKISSDLHLYNMKYNLNFRSKNISTNKHKNININLFSYINLNTFTQITFIKTFLFSF